MKELKRLVKRDNMNNIKKIRQLQGMTQQQLADKIGMSRQYIGELERDIRDIHGVSTKILKSIADALDVRMEDLISPVWRRTKDSYKDFSKIYLGESNIASVVMVGCQPQGGAKAELLRFGEGGSYTAYFVTKDIPITEHYEKVFEFRSRLAIYDDKNYIGVVKAEKIEVYRAGEFGCVIKAVDGKFTN